MNRPRHKSGLGFFLGIAVGLLLAGSARGQERRTVVPFEGFEAFGHILFRHELKPLASIEMLADVSLDETVIIILGDPRPLDSIKAQAGGWEKFQEGGGAILIACDYREQTRLEHWKLKIAGIKVRQDRHFSYQRQWEECPLVTEGLSFRHPLFKDMDSRKGVATNRPSYLEGPETNLPPLAEFSPHCFSITDLLYRGVRGDLPQGTRIGFGYNPAFIHGSHSGASPSERMAVIANQGVFMNGMMIQEDNDNFQFAWNAVAWLREGPHGNRKHALLVVEGKVVTRFGLPLSRPGRLPIPRIQVFNEMLRGLAMENRFNRMLLDNVGQSPILRGLLLAATALLLVLAARRIILSRYRLDTAATLVVGAEQAVADPLLVQREQALLSEGNLWEPAQVLVRQFFLDQGVAAPFWEESRPPPAVEAAGNWWQRHALTSQVGRFWAMAQTSPGERVSPRHFRRLVQTLEELTTAVREGRVRLANRG